MENFGDDLLEVYDDSDIYRTAEEARYELHNLNGLCGCFECEEYRKKFIWKSLGGDEDERENKKFQGTWLRNTLGSSQVYHLGELLLDVVFRFPG